MRCRARTCARRRSSRCRDELLACLDHLLAAAGNQSVMTSELRVTLADHPAGNYRVLMNLADELLAVAAERELPRLDEKLFLEVVAQTTKRKTAGAAARKR
jgi:general secretion pathway protein A